MADVAAGCRAMSSSPLPGELKTFLATHIHSIEQLEILCLFVESPGKEWHEEEVYRKIQSTRESVSANLQSLADSRLLLRPGGGGCRLSAEDSELSRLAAELVKTYRSRHVSVIEAIYQRPLDPIQTFSDAFQLRKKKP